MGSKSETGNAVNAGNFSRMIFFCEEAGGNYNPPDAAISVANLKIKDQKQLDAIALFQDKAGTWMQDVNAREAVMLPVNKLTTRIKNVAAVCNVLPQFIKDVTGLVKKIQGVRATPKIKTEPGDPNSPTDESIKQISAAQTGIDNKLDHLAMLLQLLSKEPKYIPNETDLTTTAIAALITSAKEKNKNVSTSTPPMENARINRNKEMYAEGTGGADLSSKVKKYFKAVYGGNSPEYHNVAKLEFKKLVK